VATLVTALFYANGRSRTLRQVVEPDSADQFYQKIIQKPLTMAA